MNTTTHHKAIKSGNGYIYRGVKIWKRNSGFVVIGHCYTGWFYYSRGTMKRCKSQIDDALDNLGLVVFKSDLHDASSHWLTK